MNEVLQFDESYGRKLEALYSTRNAVLQRESVLRATEIRKGAAVLDIGCGPGFLSQQIVAYVGEQGRVCGVDISEEMVNLARHRCRDYACVEFTVGDAANLQYADGEFDLAFSTQVYEYLDDVPAALSELYRILKPGGRALILDTDQDSLVWYSEKPELMKQILQVWDEHLIDPHLPRKLIPQLREAGFTLDSANVIALLDHSLDEGSFSYHMIDLIAQFALDRGSVSKSEAREWAEHLRHLGRENRYFFSLNRYMFVVKK